MIHTLTSIYGTKERTQPILTNLCSTQSERNVRSLVRTKPWTGAGQVQCNIWTASVQAYRLSNDLPHRSP